MATPAAATSIVNPKPTIAPAYRQTSIPADEILHSTNAGVIIERVGQVRNEFRSEGRIFARELAEYINTRQTGIASVFLYEESFGTKDKIHWLIHMRSLDDYAAMVHMGAGDEKFRDLILRDRIPPEKGGGTWDRMFLDGSLQETVLLPQHWKMYGTVAGGAATTAPPTTPSSGSALPAARHQTSLPEDEILNSVTAGVLIHRTAQLKYDFRSEGRQFAREAAESINLNQPGVASAFVYEEAFGPADRIHWLIHLESMSAYYKLIEMHVKDEKVRELYLRDWIAPEKGGGTWSRMFVDGSMIDTALTPQHWKMYATQPEG